MAQQTLNNGETGLSFRTKLNDNFTELYGSYAKNNTTTTNPAATNDNSQGYSVGSTWLNTTTDAVFRCFDATTNAAVWVQMGVIDHPGYLSGLYYSVQRSTSGAQPLAADTLVACPIYIAQAVNVQALGFRVTTAGAGGNARIGVYSNVSARPGSLLTQTASPVSVASAATVFGALPANYLLPPGMYWIGMIISVGASFQSMSSENYTPTIIGSSTASDVFTNASGPAGVTGTGTYAGGLPSSFGTATVRSVHPLVGFQVA